MEEFQIPFAKADQILKYIIARKNQSVSRVNIQDVAIFNSQLGIQLLIQDELITQQSVEGINYLAATDKAQIHLSHNGYDNSMSTLKMAKKEKSFKKHLEEISTLLILFGVFNAVILFCDQLKTKEKDWVIFISVSMYLLSILVLVEIIIYLLNNAQRNFRYQLLYFLLCMVTIGIGAIFIVENIVLIGVVVGILIIFFFLSLFLLGLTHFIALLITRKNAPWFKKHSKAVVTTTLLIGLLMYSYFLKRIHLEQIVEHIVSVWKKLFP